MEKIEEVFGTALVDTLLLLWGVFLWKKAILRRGYKLPSWWPILYCLVLPVPYLGYWFFPGQLVTSTAAVTVLIFGLIFRFMPKDEDHPVPDQEDTTAIGSEINTTKSTLVDRRKSRGES